MDGQVAIYMNPEVARDPFHLHRHAQAVLRATHDGIQQVNAQHRIEWPGSRGGGGARRGLVGRPGVGQRCRGAPLLQQPAEPLPKPPGFTGVRVASRGLCCQ